MPYYFVRHGQTDWNKEKRLQGIRDIPLNETGLNQARELRKQVELNNLVFDKVYTSPLTRAVVTAEMVSNKSRDELIISDKIIEMSFGDFEGVHYNIDPNGNVSMLEENIVNFGRDPEKYIPSNGETFQAVIARAKEFLIDLKNNTNPDENVLVVTHGGVIHAIMYNIENRDNLKTFWLPKTGNCVLVRFNSLEPKSEYTIITNSVYV